MFSENKSITLKNVFHVQYFQKYCLFSCSHNFDYIKKSDMSSKFISRMLHLITY